MRIFGWTAGKPGQGSFRYRLSTPLTEAAHLGLATWEWGSQLSAEAAREYDVVLGQGFATPQALTVWESMARGGDTLMVLDHDDDWRNVRPDNPIFDGIPNGWEWYQRETIPAVERLLAISDLVTVTVPHLAEQYRQFTDAPVIVLPNTFDEVLLEIPQRVRQPGEHLRVGWSGSPTHSKDWSSAVSGILYGLNKTKATLVLMGADYRKLVRYANVEFHEWKTAIDEYYLVLTSYHVALAPLADDMFNRSKSPLKALEASALGIPVIASDAGPYRDFIIPGETGFLCRTDHDWMKAIRTLDNDEDLRQAMGQAARAHAAQFTTRQWAPAWIDAYREATARKQGLVPSRT